MRRRVSTDLAALLGLSAFPICAITTSPAVADDGAFIATRETLAFDGSTAEAAPRGWFSGPADRVHVDRSTIGRARQSVRIEGSDDPEAVALLVDRLPASFVGKSIRLRGRLRTKDVTGMVSLYLREDGRAVASADTASHASATREPVLAYADSRATPLTGTHDWTEMSVTLPIDRYDAERFEFGVALKGSGTAWVEDLQLLVDGVSVFDVPQVAPPEPAIRTDHRFDHGSGLDVATLDARQLDRLVVLAKVWGLLKYRDAHVVSGERHWDYDLLALLPRVLAASSDREFQEVLMAWVDALGPTVACDDCEARVVDDVALKGDLDWLSDIATLGRPLSRKLLALAANTPRTEQQFFVAFAPHGGNPVFVHEPDYPDIPLADRGFRILAAFRFWNIVESWSPYRDLLRGAWTSALRESLSSIVLAPDDAAYRRALIALIAKVHDSHSNLWGSLDVLPPAGGCRVPVRLRYVEGRWVVVAPLTTTLDGSSDAIDRARSLTIGDVVVSVDGQPVEERIADWRPYYAASNDASQRRDLAAAVLGGPCDDATIDIVRQGRRQKQVVRRERVAYDAFEPHDLPGPAFRLLSDDVAYLKLSSVKAADVAGAIASAAGTRGLIVDIRNYPSEYVVYALGGALVDRETPFVRFTIGMPSQPGTFRWGAPLTLTPTLPHYAGRVVVLVDEVTQSQAEYTAMALRASPRAVIVGSTTAGADGNVSNIPLPGRLHTMISGIGVFYPDGRPTQRVGIVPDVMVAPTIAGIIAGRDEVLEVGVRQIVGADRARSIVDGTIRR